MDRKEKTRERVRKHRCIQSALSNVASCSHFSDKTEDVTYNTEEFHGDFVNKLSQEKGQENTFTYIQEHSDSSISDVMESTIQYYDVNTDTSHDNNDDNDNDDDYWEHDNNDDDNYWEHDNNDDDVDYWEHDNSTNKSNVNKSQNDSEIEELRKWAVTCNIRLTHLDKLLQILRRKLIPQLPKSAISFLNTSQATYNIKAMKGVGECTGEYVYLGIRNGLTNCIDSNVYRNDTIFLQVNVDGASPYRSSTKQLWPILCKVIFDPDIYSPFPVALYYGDTKPGNVDEYLYDFVEEINLLQRDDVYIDEQKYAVQLKHFICDIPARKFLKQIKGHGGYAACERCKVYGKRVGFPNQRVVYPDEDCRKRSDQSFRPTTRRTSYEHITIITHTATN